MSTSLPLVEFRGPDIPGIADPKKNAFWVLRACVPEFRHQDAKAPQQNRIHGIRTLLADADQVKSEDRQWRTPRVMSLHLIIGAKGRFEEDQERFFVRLPDKTDDFESNKGKRYHTFDRKTPDVAVFQHVAAEPMYEGAKWPELSDTDMHVPPFRLVAGAIELRVKDDASKWLGEPLLDGSKDLVIRLTPDGIEFDAKLPFPAAAQAIQGRFLLFPVRGGTRVRLLPNQLGGDVGEWQRAWGRVTPRLDPAEEALIGLKVEARRDGLPPAFVWSTTTSGAAITGVSASVDVPAADLRVRLLSPKGKNGVDGEVTLDPEVFTLAPFDAARVKTISESWTEKPKWMLTATIPGAAPAPAPTRLVLDSRPSDGAASLVATKKNAPVVHVCAHDEVALAAALRAAHGLEEPLAGTPDGRRPLLSAFVPLDDGWLQMPVPNVPPPDLEKDDDLTVRRAIPNVLSGYLRYAQAGAMPPVLSAFPPVGENAPRPFIVTEAPWVLTVEGAQSVDFAVGFDDDDGKQTSVLKRGAASLGGPELSTRGFVWISADRPDVLESLPRLGAGAGVYLDIPIETLDIETKPVLRFAIHALGVAVTRGAPFDGVARKNLAVSASFDAEATPWTNLITVASDALENARKVLTGSAAASDVRPPLPPVLWQRHETTPLAAEMPMTRAAGSAVRPLESRDLVPFLIDVPDATPFPLVRLAWPADAVFPTVTHVDGSPLARRSVAAWPWPERELSLAEGIAFTAFGVPGAEVAFGDESGFHPEPFSRLRFALRYDLPALDEAFATASLPPQPPEKTLPEEREVPPPVPVPLAHDWPAMHRFWDEQNRRHQLARVHHSYLAAYRAIADGKAKKTPVQDLVGGLFWNPLVGFQKGEGSLPYGKVTIGDAVDVTADEALLGISGHFTFDGELKKVPKGTENSLEVLGYAPESFLEGDFLYDSRRTGTRPAEIKVKDRLLWRELRIREPKEDDLADRALATLLAPIDVGKSFRFWFKDLPVVANKFSRASLSIDFAAWQDGHLPLAGFEWRLIPTMNLGNPAKIFDLGRDRIPFFGFLLEPLRLTACDLELDGGKPTGRVELATILARLHLGPAKAGPSDDGNLVTLGLEIDGDILKIVALDGKNLRFAFDAFEHAETVPRRVGVTGGVKWDGSKPSFDITELTVSMFGADRPFGGAELLPAPAPGQPVVIKWDRGGVTVQPGSGMFVVDSLRIETKVTAAGESDGPARLAINRRLLITPRGTGKDAFKPPTPAFELSLTAGNEVSSLRIVGLEVKGGAATFSENEGALTLTVAAKVTDGKILPGFKIDGHLSLGVMARLGEMQNGSIELTAGWLDGELVAPALPSARVALRRIAFHAEQKRRPDRGVTEAQWIGAMRFFGKLSLDSAIGWPGVENGADPDTNQITEGTHVVRVDPTSFHVHHVEYVLDGHALPFDLAACIGDLRADAVWAASVASKHTLKDKQGKEVSFVAVEAITIGAAKAIVPELGKPNAQKPEEGFATDPVTWAARHREIVVDGEVKPGKLAQGMVKAGVGRIATVLSGALGLPFRAAFGAHAGLFLAGGFAGLVDATDGERSALLRLPVLAALDDGAPLSKPGVISGKVPATDVNVAWVDGRAARNVIATLRGAVTPASSSESALRSALLAGSRTQSSAGLTAEETAMAILVEQHFDDRADNLEKGDLEKTPFFVAAMVGLARTLPRLGKDKAPVVLSLLAGHAIKDFARGLAAAVVTRNLPLENGEADAERLRPHLATLGTDVVVHGWPGPPVAQLEGVIPVALVAGPAFADHVQPRAVIVRTVQGGRSQYDAPPLPRATDRPRKSRPDSNRAFADGGRGYGLELGNEPLRWLAGPEEGGTRPYRDEAFQADPLEPQGSGLAGLSRVMAMPFHAAKSGANAVDDLVWVAQTRAPIYLPLPLADVDAPPIPWLTPGTPRSRHVTRDTIAATFAGLRVDLDKVQPILPTAATVASVSDRAGISLARIARFESATPDAKPFDGLHARFGRPAQGGSWSVRTERTPRPAPLPPNRGDEERDRRPCASPLLASQPVMALEGPADRVAGEGEGATPRWTVTFVAAQEWDGMVTESWDGTIRLRAEIDLATKTLPTDSAAKTLFRLLFPVTTADPNTLQTRAMLVIGDAVVPFRRLHVGKATAFKPEGDLHRAVVPLVLDARPTDTSEQQGAALAAIAAAFAGPALPAVEVRLVVHPDSSRDNATALTVIVLTTDAPALAIGDARAPVTLRLPLAPVIRSRGALPLAPTSLLFIDPAYDAGLSSAPAEDRGRISAKGAEGRGELFAVLYADRARVNRKASVTFMMDVAYEKKLDRREEVFVDAEKIDGDIIKDTASNEFDLRIAVVPKSGERRVLFVAPPSALPIAGFTPPRQPTVPLARVCELPLATLVEKDGTAARLEPGDVLELQVEESSARRIAVKVLGNTTNDTDAIQLDPLHAIPIARALRIVLTDEPVVEPPSALYAALVRRAQAKVRLSLPLYAQSPLPWRVDLRDAKRDFRLGLLRRAATFIWTLGRPRRERPDTGIHIVKADRNGQTHLPAETEFQKSRPL